MTDGSPPLLTAVIGTGAVAHVHAQALIGLPESRFIAVCGRDRHRAEAFAREYGVAAFSDIRAFLESGLAEVATVCTPHPSHSDIAVACADAGIHVLVEKPLAVDLDGADRALEAARASGVRLGVVSQRRYYRPVVRMKEAIAAGKIGAPGLGTVTVLGWRDPSYYARAPWRGTWSGEGGGVLVNQAVHQLDLLQWFMGPVSKVAAFWDNLNHPEIDVEDTAVASVRFSGGGVGSIVASNSQRPGVHAKVHVHGGNGASVGVQTDGGSMFIAGHPGEIEAPFNDLWTVEGEEGFLGRWREEDRKAFAAVDPSSHFHMIQIRDFLSSVREGREPAVTGRDGRRTVALFQAMYQSQREGSIVSIADGGP